MEDIVGFSCYYSGCGKRFLSKHSLARHVNTAHLEIKPFKCPICEWYFSSKQNLNSHLRTHVKHLKRGGYPEELTAQLPLLQAIIKDKNYGLTDHDGTELPPIQESRQGKARVPLCPGLIQKFY